MDINIKKWFLIWFCLILLTVSGCTQKGENQQPILYYGEGEDWFGTYTISKVKSSYFDSLYFQYIVNRSLPVGQQQRVVGPVEYELSAGKMKLSSNEPQPLEGIGSFHTATEVNAEIIDEDFPEKVRLVIKWQDKKEIITLEKQK